MVLFLTSVNREIVRSVLGFAKVAVITLPKAILVPRLQTLVPGLMSWSREHKAQFRVKIKHIFERMIRRFGFELVDKYCPEDDRKFINNIHKTKERQKRKKEVGSDEEDEDGATSQRRKPRFESEYDQAIYGSDNSESADDDTDHDASHTDHARSRTGGGSKAYILDDSAEPLDLLDRKALAHISSKKPMRMKQPLNCRKHENHEMDSDGKLFIGAGMGENNEDDADGMAIDTGGDGKLEEGIGAYVDAIRGRDAVQRGRGGRLKFSNKRKRVGEREDEKEDDGYAMRKRKLLLKNSGGKNSAPSGPTSGKGAIHTRSRGGVGAGVKSQRAQRRGLGIGKVKAGGVGKGVGRR